jgi:hypothetical protein
LYSKISQGVTTDNWHKKNIINTVCEILKPALKEVKYVIPSPHTSPLAFNRFCPDGRKWSEVAQQQIACAVKLNTKKYIISQDLFS